MRVVVQRVSEASVKVAGTITGSIEHGLLVFVGVEDADTMNDVTWIGNKIVGLRIFNDHAGVMNIDVKEADGGILLVSQFTLHASTKKGNRPSYIKASKAAVAIPLYEALKTHLQNMLVKPVATGVFGADMKVALVNDGPVTIFIDSKNKE